MGARVERGVNLKFKEHSPFPFNASTSLTINPFHKSESVSDRNEKRTDRAQEGQKTKIAINSNKQNCQSNNCNQPKKYPKILRFVTNQIDLNQIAMTTKKHHVALIPSTSKQQSTLTQE
jgi:BRCT domain type II-containing protein